MVQPFIELSLIVQNFSEQNLKASGPQKLENVDKDDGRVGRKVDNIHSTGSWIGKVHVIVVRTRTRVTSWRTLAGQTD